MSNIQLYNRGDQALLIGLKELEQMGPAKRYYYLKELWYIAEPGRPVYHRGPNQRRNKNIIWLMKRQYIRVNADTTRSDKLPLKFYIVTPLGQTLLDCFTEEQLEEWRKSTKTYQHFHGHYNSEEE